MRFITDKDNEHLKTVTSLGLIKDKNKMFDPEGIFSASIFGSKDFSCDCGNLKGSWYKDEICENCNTSIKDPKDNIYRNGKFSLPNGLKIINPIIYLMIQKYVKNLEKLLNPQLKHIDIDGHIIEQDANDNYLIYFTKFVDEYEQNIHKLIPEELAEGDDELMEFKQFLLNNEDSVVLNTIALLPLHLRPAELSEKQIHLEPLNKSFISINTHIHSLKTNIIEDDIIAIEHELFEIQKLYIDLYDKIVALISSKEGLARDQILSNKINFSGRAVITVKHDNDPRSVTLPYIMFTELYMLKILTIMVEKHKMTYIDAYDYYHLNRFNFDDEIINKCVDEILLTKPVVLLNRNPSLHLLSIQSFYVSDVTKDYTIKLAKSVLQAFNAETSINRKLIA